MRIAKRLAIIIGRRCSTLAPAIIGREGRVPRTKLLSPAVYNMLVLGLDRGLR